MTHPMANRLLDTWHRLHRWPAGDWLFSRAVCFKAPYFATVAPRITRLLLDRVSDRLAPANGQSERLDLLTGRERDVLGLVARGLSNAEIAAELYVAEATVKTHLGNLMAKLHLRDRAQAVVFAYESGLVRPSS